MQTNLIYKKMIDQYLNLLKQWKWSILIVSLLLVGIASSGLRYLTFTSDFKAYFSANDPQLLAYETLQNVYADTQNALIVVEPRSGTVFTREVLATISEITSKAWKLPFATRVDSITNFQHSRADGDNLIIEDLLPMNIPITDEQLAQTRKIALGETLLRNRLISADSLTTAVNVAFKIEKNHPEQIGEAVNAVRRLSLQMETSHPEIQIHLTGSLILDYAFTEASERDLAILMPIMLVVVIILLWIMSGSLTATIATTAIIAIAIIATMGVISWFGIEITGASAAAPPIILTIAVANSIHLLTHTLHTLGHGKTRSEAIDESLRNNLSPIALTNLTTCISFLTMNFSDSPPFQDLGNIVAIGVNITFIATIAVLPILLTLLPMKAHKESLWGSNAIYQITEFSMQRKHILLPLIGIITTILISFISRNEINDEYLKYFAEDAPFRQATEFTAARLTGVTSVEYSLDSKVADGLNDPGFLHRIGGFADWLRDQPEIVHVFSLTDILKQLNKNMHQDDPSYYKLPEQRDLTAQYLLLYEMSLPNGLDLNNIINVTKSATRITVSLKGLSTRQLFAFEQRAAQWLDSHDLPAANTPATGPDIMFAHIGDRNMRDMLEGTIWEIIAITTILILALRSLSLGLLSVIPNLIPAACAFGIWGLLVGQVNLAVSVVTGMTLGIIIDDTVHFLSAYRQARYGLGLAPHDAVRTTMSTVGNALLITTVILACGFGVLLFSNYKATAWMGMLTSLTILLALVTEVLLMPALLVIRPGNPK
ncbi:MAG: MMPL family transporter [Gammaproteobacteria bacterium]|nr:MMPL family transporter [Gammaproteobacteria bacterium]